MERSFSPLVSIVGQVFVSCCKCSDGLGLGIAGGGLVKKKKTLVGSLMTFKRHVCMLLVLTFIVQRESFLQIPCCPFIRLKNCL